MRLHRLLIPLAAFLAILPMLLAGPSCGHDFDFHLLNWLEASTQLTHLQYPHWAYTPAYNAGEPRFIFYPPLSWLIGAALTQFLPFQYVPIAFTWLALTLTGFTLHRFARPYATPAAATLAAILYTLNPYMLFTAYERTAYAELLAAAFIPLLFAAILTPRPTIPAIALPVALLWLTNAPAAVMSSYALALLTLTRLALAHRTKSDALAVASGAPSSTRQSRGRVGSPPGVFARGGESVGSPPGVFARGGESVGSPPGVFARGGESVGSPPGLFARGGESVGYRTKSGRFSLALASAAGTFLGLLLAAFYILPAAYQRRYVAINMAVIPGMAPADNFLFHHTGLSDDALAHDAVLHTASLIAILLIALTALALLLALFACHSAAKRRNLQLPVVPSLSNQPPTPCTYPVTPSFLLPLTLLAVVITILLTPISLPIWTHTPQLAFLQFPWRLLALLAPILAITTAIALSQIHWSLTPGPLSLRLSPLLSLLLAALLIPLAWHNFHQSCDAPDTPESRAALYHSPHGTEPTDEYTPKDADPDALHPEDPPYWLIPPSSPIDTPAPHSAPPGPAPDHLTFTGPATLILNRRQYPLWLVTLNHRPIVSHLERQDGLIAIPIPPGPATIDLHLRHTPDELFGLALSLLAAIILLALRLRS